MGKRITACYVIILIHHIYVAKYTNMNIDITNDVDGAIKDLKKYQLRYFTTWNMIIQNIYLILAIVSDILQMRSKINKELEQNLQRIKGYVFTSFVLPFTLYVAIMFWTIFSIDRELIFPSILDSILPRWINHSMHTNILLLPALEFFLNNKIIPNFKSAFIGSSIVTIFYDITLLFTYYESSKWLYGMFYIFNWPERVAFMIFSYLFGAVTIKGGIVAQKYIYNKYVLAKKTL